MKIFVTSFVVHRMYITTEFPFKVDKNSIFVDYRPDDPLVNISFKVYTYVTVI